MSRSSMCSLPFRFSNLNFVQITHFREACCMPCSSHPPWFLFLANWKYRVSNATQDPPTVFCIVTYFPVVCPLLWHTFAVGSTLSGTPCMYTHLPKNISLYASFCPYTFQLTCPILHVQTQLRVRCMQIIGLRKWVSVLESLITCSLKLIQL
jgi:hypothetical protein